MEKDFIKEYWNKNAQKFQGSYEASWADIYAINLEIETIGQYIKDGDNVLDVGCANGYSTLSQWKNNRLKSIVGVDYSNNMIEYAKINQNNFGLRDDNIKFYEGDIRNLEFEDNTFDVVYTTRVLINLSNWEQQKQGISECIRVVKKGGKVILSEAFWEPLVLLNSIRKIVNLKPLVEHDFNRYLKQGYLEEYLNNIKVSFINKIFLQCTILDQDF
jgi:ubiquinone/menaquinone biosynthesis C-methylase UbiE